jgi:hypothetical protein
MRLWRPGHRHDRHEHRHEQRAVLIREPPNGETKVESTEHRTHTGGGATAIVTMNLGIGWPILSTKDAAEGQKAFVKKRPARITRQ